MMEISLAEMFLLGLCFVLGLRCFLYSLENKALKILTVNLGAMVADKEIEFYRDADNGVAIRKLRNVGGL